MSKREARGVKRLLRSAAVGKPVGQRCAESRGLKASDPAGGARQLETDPPAILRQQLADAIRPFDQAEASAIEVVGDAQVFKGGGSCSR